jgi:hypothetical protein
MQRMRAQAAANQYGRDAEVFLSAVIRILPA